MYREVTKNVQIDVQPEFVAEHSDPKVHRFVFSYKVKITNLGKVETQLLSRHWIISDGHGKVEEVEGPGVIGQQPKLAPGATFEYSSFCPLTTPTGNMRGTYLMVNGKGEKYEVKIPLFFLRDMAHLH